MKKPRDAMERWWRWRWQEREPLLGADFLDSPSIVQAELHVAGEISTLGQTCERCKRLIVTSFHPWIAKSYYPEGTAVVVHSLGHFPYAEHNRKPPECEKFKLRKTRSAKNGGRES